MEDHIGNGVVDNKHLMILVILEQMINILMAEQMINLAMPLQTMSLAMAE